MPPLLAALLLLAHPLAALRGADPLPDPAPADSAETDGTVARLAAVLAPGAVPRAVAGGLRFTEGPSYDPVAGTWVFSDIPADRLYRLTALDGAPGSLTVALEPSANGNGNLIDAQGRRTTFHHGTRRVTRTDAGGAVEVLAEQVDGKALNSPNDGAWAADGSLWFTDPTWGLGRRPQEQPGRGVFRVVPGQAPERLIADLDQPNGLCFSPDGGTVYIAESGPGHRVLAYRVAAGRPVDQRVFAVIRPGGPDGMRCDTAGRLYVAAGDGVQVFTPDGIRLGVLPTPKTATNCAFGGPGRHTLLITAQDTVWAVELLASGAP